jgi:hypothetical protein
MKNKPKMIEFVNSKGVKVRFPVNMTLGEVYKLGVKKIWLQPKEKPLPKDPKIFTHAP